MRQCLDHTTMLLLIFCCVTMETFPTKNAHFITNLYRQCSICWWVKGGAKSKCSFPLIIYLTGNSVLSLSNFSYSYFIFSTFLQGWEVFHGYQSAPINEILLLNVFLKLKPFICFFFRFISVKSLSYNLLKGCNTKWFYRLVLLKHSFSWWGERKNASCMFAFMKSVREAVRL